MILLKENEKELYYKASNIMPNTELSEILKIPLYLIKRKKNEFGVSFKMYKRSKLNIKNIKSLCEYLNIDYILLNLEDFIKEYLLEKEKFVNHRITKNWFESTNNLDYYNMIIERTYFLKNVILRERIFCILNGITEILKCKCGRKKRFIKTYYNYTCGDKNCIIDLRIQNGYKIGNDMLTVHKRRALKSAKTMKEKGIRKDAEKKRQKTMNKIDLKTNLSRNKLMGVNVSKALNRISENNKTVAQNGAIKAANTMKTTILNNGLTIYQNAGIKQRITRKKIYKKYNSVPEKSSIKKYKNSDIYYQGSFEKNFLDFISDLNLFNKVKRGLSFTYSVNKSYYSDFLLDFIIFEIKSTWTYDRCGTDKELRFKNNLKWKSVLNKNYRFIVIWNKKFFREYFLEDFNDLYVNLFENLKDFNSENLIDLVEE